MSYEEQFKYLKEAGFFEFINTDSSETPATLSFKCLLCPDNCKPKRCQESSLTNLKTHLMKTHPDRVK